MIGAKRIDAVLGKILFAARLKFENFTPDELTAMRAAMVKIMSDCYIDGSNDAIKALKNDKG